MQGWKLLSLEEKLNVATHGLGLILAIAGSPFLISVSLPSGGVITTLSLVVFCISMISMYFSSTFYHLSVNKRWKMMWRKIDHMAIFALIGGTYTPFISIYYSEMKGWYFLLILWILIISGIVMKIFRTGRQRYLSTIIYLLLGWMVVIIYNPVTINMSHDVFYWLVVGGVFYTVGIIFYLWRRLKFNHAIWHLFVVAGTTGHFLSLYLSL